MTEYKFMRTRHDDIVGCDCCGAEVPLYQFSKTRIDNSSVVHMLLCEVCSSTMISATHEYKHRQEDAFQAQALAACTNILRKDVGAFKNSNSVCISDDQLEGKEAIK